MSIAFLLYIILMTEGQPDKLTLGGTHAYPTLEACRDDAQRMMNWLRQDSVSVEFQCLRIERRRMNVDQGIG